MWKNEVNSVFFSDMDANIIAQKKLTVFGEEYKQIQRNEEYLKGYSLKNIQPLDSRLIYSEQ